MYPLDYIGYKGESSERLPLTGAGENLILDSSLRYSSLDNSVLAGWPVLHLRDVLPTAIHLWTIKFHHQCHKRPSRSPFSPQVVRVKSRQRCPDFDRTHSPLMLDRI